MTEQGMREKVYGFPALLTEKRQHFCPGCSHGILAKTIAEVLAETGLGREAVGVYGVGCAALMYGYIGTAGVAAPPGGAPAVASGVKGALPGRCVFTYQGDGDLCYDLTALIGAAQRGEPITVIVENNFTMAMSGGALSPTSPLGMVTTTTPEGRRQGGESSPLGVAGLLRDVKGVSYVARGSSHSPGAVRKTKRMIARALEVQMYGSGMGFVEVLGMCPTNLGVPPVEAVSFVKRMIEEIDLGELKRP